MKRKHYTLLEYPDMSNVGTVSMEDLNEMIGKIELACSTHFKKDCFAHNARLTRAIAILRVKPMSIFEIEIVDNGTQTKERVFISETHLY